MLPITVKGTGDTIFLITVNINDPVAFWNWIIVTKKKHHIVSPRLCSLLHSLQYQSFIFNVMQESITDNKIILSGWLKILRIHMHHVHTHSSFTSKPFSLFCANGTAFYCVYLVTKAS